MNEAPFTKTRDEAWLSTAARAAMDAADGSGWETIIETAEGMTTSEDDRDLLISIWVETRTPEQLRALYDSCVEKEDLEDMFNIVDLSATCSVAEEEGQGMKSGPFMDAFRGTEIMS